MRIRDIAILAALLLAPAACHHGDFYDPPMPELPPAATVTPTLLPASLIAPRWQAALVAGDTTLHVDDDAVAALQLLLEADGVPLDDVHAFSADREQYVGGVEGTGVRGLDSSRSRRSGRQEDDPEPPSERDPPRSGTIEPARPALVLRTLLALAGRNGGACLAYFGSKTDDNDLDLLNGSISPDQIDRALGAGCGAAPTVLIVSGCGTGSFAVAPVSRPNRLILTAALRGRAGFGCGPNMAFTTFDECLIGALERPGRWVDAFDATRRCVTRREDLVGQPHVEPQSSVGNLVAALPTPAPARSTAGPDGFDIVFRQGIGRITVDDAPYFSSLKARTRAAFEAYLHAPVPKALALTLAGTVTWAAAEHGESSDDVARIALQRCEWESSGACILYARDAHLAAVSGGGVPEIHPPLLVRSGPVTPADAPFIRTDQRAQIAHYLGLPQPKVLAIAPNSETIGIGSGATIDDARTTALRKCSTNGAACRVFAIQDQIVLGYQ